MPQPLTSTTIQLKWSNTAPLVPHLSQFLQGMLDRLVVGHFRYGPPNPEKEYAGRATKELKAYARTGNKEHLRNAANYCLLEFAAPSHPSPYDSKVVRSATRKPKDMRNAFNE